MLYCTVSDDIELYVLSFAHYILDYDTAEVLGFQGFKISMMAEVALKRLSSSTIDGF
jgi:hypothetical protein